MVRRPLKLAGILLLGGLLGSGCVVEVTFDPVGTDFSVTGDWAIELGGVSMLPNAANCAAAGIDRVQLQLFHESTSDVFTDGSLEADCEQGTFTSGMAFAYGSYRAQWVALDSSRNVVARSGFIPFFADFPTTNVILPDAVFVVSGPPPSMDFTLNLFWRDPAAPAAPGGDCNYAKVTDMFYELTQGSTVIAESGGEIACGVELFIPDLNPGTYDMYIEGFDRASGIGQTHMTLCTFTHNARDEEGDCEVLAL
jgi:hypothetical protein